MEGTTEEVVKFSMEGIDYLISLYPPLDRPKYYAESTIDGSKCFASGNIANKDPMNILFFWQVTHRSVKRIFKNLKNEKNYDRVQHKKDIL